MLTQATLDILVENRLNDSKPWYEAHKPEIRKLVLEPFFELIGELGPSMLQIDPFLVTEPRVGRTLSRVVRDTRFTHDKSRYRDSMWLYFNREKNLFPGYPGFFFELKPIYVWWGCGFYLADSDLVASYRKMILDRDPLFLEAKKAMDAQTVFRMDDSDRFKRTKFPEEPEDIRHWLDRKSIYFAHTEDDPTVAFTDQLADRLWRDFALLVPLYRFLCAAHERKITPERVFRNN